MLSTSAASRKDRNTAANSPTFQHRHFAAIADILKDNSDLANHGAICRRMAVRLAGTNPNFDRARFLKACGLND